MVPRVIKLGLIRGRAPALGCLRQDETNKRGNYKRRNGGKIEKGDTLDYTSIFMLVFVFNKFTGKGVSVQFDLHTVKNCFHSQPGKPD